MRFLLIISIICAVSGSAFAQSYTEMYEQISTINRVQPLSNPSYARTYEVLTRKVQDRKNRVVGEVKDVLISKYGPVEALNVNLDRLNLGTIIVDMQDTGIKSLRDSYAFANYDEEGIQDLYPTLLANIQTAAGEDQNVVSLQNLTGASVKTTSGDMVGKVEDVLFSKTGNVAEALYVQMKYKTMSKDHIAIPFGVADYSKLDSHKEVILFDDQAKAMSDFVSRSKK